MTSEKQIIANRENAKLGGVKTEEGKEISKMNALQHGLLSGEIILKGEDEIAFNRLKNGLIDDLKPKGELEFFCVERLIASIWRLKRSLVVQKAKYELILNPIKIVEFYQGIQDTKEEPTQEQIKQRNIIKVFESSSELQVRYEASIENDIWKSLHELERLQAKRNGEKVMPRVAVDVDINDQKNGFVS